jgi:hypothetical protein
VERKLRERGIDINLLRKTRKTIEIPPPPVEE